MRQWKLSIITIIRLTTWLVNEAVMSRVTHLDDPHVRPICTKGLDLFLPLPLCLFNQGLQISKCGSIKLLRSVSIGVQREDHEGRM